MKLIVTGGAGFIGSNFLLYINREYPEYDVLCIDKLTYASDMSHINKLFNNPKYNFIKEDICNLDSIYSVFENFKPDAVINFAAESHVDRSIEGPEIFLKTNYIGTGVLLDACLKYGKIRFHQISTDEVYGDLPFDSDEKFEESFPLNPSSPYSASKAAADLLVLSYYKTFGLPVTISRSANNYGKHQYREKLIPLIISKALCNESIPVYGTGENVREWLNVEDHCSALDLILHKGSIGEIYNIGGKISVNNLYLVKKICSILGVSEELITFVEDRKGHDRRYSTNCNKLKAMGWTEKNDFETGLINTVEWYKSKFLRK